MNVIIAHPHRMSFNHAIANAAVRELTAGGHKTIVHDLYREGFDPVLPAQEIHADAPLPEGIHVHCKELALCDGMVIVHPNWWGQPPAILKGWVDRVLRPKTAYEFLEGDAGEGVPNGLLTGRRVVVFNISNTPDKREKEVFGDPLELLWKQCIFGLCGVEVFYRRMFNVVVASTREQREAWLKEAREIVCTAFPRAARP